MEEKKEIWKLLELLNEFEKGKKYNKAEWKVSENNQLHYKYVVSDTPNGEWFSEKYLSRDVSQAYLISSQYGFVKWLVKQDKIDSNEIAKRTYVKVDWEFYELILGCHYNLCQQVLMLLSISDNYIDDLISYLK